MGRDRNGALTSGQGWGRAGDNPVAKIREIIGRAGMGFDFKGGFADGCRRGLAET